MKVIGKSKQGVIVEMSNSECANIRGYQSPYSDDYQAPEIGSSYYISKIFKKLYDMRSHKDKISESINNLNEIIYNLEVVEDTVLYMEDTEC